MDEFSLTVTVSNIPRDPPGLKFAFHQVLTAMAEASGVTVMIADAEEAEEAALTDLLASVAEAIENNDAPRYLAASWKQWQETGGAKPDEAPTD